VYDAYKGNTTYPIPGVSSILLWFGIRTDEFDNLIAGCVARIDRYRWIVSIVLINLQWKENFYWSLITNLKNGIARRKVILIEDATGFKGYFSSFSFIFYNYREVSSVGTKSLACADHNMTEQVCEVSPSS
jgi:hypothetical protein